MPHAFWLKKIVNSDELKITAEVMVSQILEDSKVFPIDAIAARGYSGVSMGGVISYLTGIPLIMVRKEDETHSSWKIEINRKLEIRDFSYVIVDDLICSGKTVKEIVDKINLNISDKIYAKLQKIYLYEDHNHDGYFMIDIIKIPIFALQ